MKANSRTLRSLAIFLAGYVPFAIFWPMYGAVTAFGIGLGVTAIVISIFAIVSQHRKTRLEVQVHPVLRDRKPS
ncbi:hypothetical protein CQ020_11250 [Arthrobacter sp. MYb23]|uniref:hypothetical protein n=1 Tax=unclassified Arthrobacter TaxID=235627 RepID=UPI000CFD3889|nr:MULTISPECIES: hypothetical protein [unclassified Arthrobacter]PRB41589.1 hypothetical protein CQ038_12525 [Arthrobacter sp. MYb51]PRB96060.1 hypothetical protein CQ020_11250 [Arthrobacter sp. MYb23]